MADKKTSWTDEQKEAITDKSSDILVSAAAGSGKTAVLTERLIRKITDPDAPVDISRILVVTFTEDAANELKTRIRDAITSAMAEFPASKHLKRQYLMLPNAKISTIHGFCLDLVRGNYELLGLSPKLRVSDEGQNTLLMQQVADSVIDGYYSSLPEYADIDDFPAFADNFITLQDASLTTRIIEIYKKLQSYPEGTSFLCKSAEIYDLPYEDISSTVWCDLLFEHVKRFLMYYLAVFEDACNTITEYTEVSDKYIPAFDSSIDGIKTILNAIEGGSYEYVKECINTVTFSRMGSKRGYEDDEVLTLFKTARSEFSAELKNIKSTYFSYSPETLSATAAKTADYLLKLQRLIAAFDRRFKYEKRKRGIIDFNDMERMAYSLLVNDDGSYTTLADEIAKKYDEVCIDEYQDVNSLQDSIFRAITRSTNRFMVGDIKQSIYGFRGAEPTIFADYRQDEGVKLISLTHNFRSDKTVIGITNEICGNLFLKLGRTVPYDGSDELRFANGSKEALEPEIVIIEDENASENEDAGGEEVTNCIGSEARYVAKRINGLIKNGAKPSDIAILLRSAKNDAKMYENALSYYGIDSRNKEQKDLFSNPEVVLLMCILNVIDNPSRDIYLAGALKSPLYNVTLSELAQIRSYAENCSLYDALVKYTEDFSFKKGEYFLNKLEEYRRMSSKPVDRLIWHIFCDSGIIGCVSDKNQSDTDRKANLMMLYEKARSFESGTFKGLYNFIKYVNDVMNSDTVVPSPYSIDDTGAVQIMTIHKSKGLQFKYVFICGASKRFNTLDESADIIIDKNAGASLKLSDESGLATVDTLFRKISALQIRNKNLEEEIRVLYVALTRAKSKLVIVASTKNSEKLKELPHLSKYASVANGYLYSRKLNFISWILLSQKSVTPEYISADEIDCITEASDASEVESGRELDENRVKELTAEFSRRFEFTYASLEASKIPAKLSVSELYPTILDDFDDSQKMSESKKPKMKVPRFIDENDSKGAKIGTATHQFMQFCDFSRLECDGIDAEIERMSSMGFLSPSVASLVSKRAIRRFLDSPLFASLKNAKNVNRELRFNVHLNASAFTSDKNSHLSGERVLVQGIIDCLYEDKDGKTVLLDYKTDYIPEGTSIPDAENMLIERHATQLSYYAAACRTVLGKSVDKVIIYSFALGRAIEIQPEKLIMI